jgi:hypothetical protein
MASSVPPTTSTGQATRARSLVKSYPERRAVDGGKTRSIAAEPAGANGGEALRIAAQLDRIATVQALAFALDPRQHCAAAIRGKVDRELAAQLFRQTGPAPVVTQDAPSGCKLGCHQVPSL